ncbi:metal ABC transporter permease [Synechococcus sp. RSCCF101]|uniref:metal ABC transporter permease n=1 Tax=Synechococcus sp. RSCCF101 TaxID=2511069 RepID=UPI001246EB32|nr:metal ABC transporter permease [Synechococcus sp. RSCCF101]QEY31510.1 metal ABC transporter permease [Synechococcus sp. RSCCF101]
MTWWLTPLLMALLTGLLAPLSGTLLLVQRRVLLGNLISHAVLPGLAVAVALKLSPLLGGALSGLLAVLLSERLFAAPAGRERDAVTNTVLAGFLGLGVLLIPLLQVRVDLEALLFGDLLLSGPNDLLWALLALLLLLGVVLRWRRELVFLGVDPQGAEACGVPVGRLRLLLALCTALVVTTAMTAVGVILVIGLMCAPALVGLSGAVSLQRAMLRASVLGALLSGGGFLLALALNWPPGPLIGVLCMALLLPPRRAG